MVADTEQRRGYGDLAQAILDLVGQAGAPVTPAQVRDYVAVAMMAFRDDERVVHGLRAAQGDEREEVRRSASLSLGQIAPDDADDRQ